MIKNTAARDQAMSSIRASLDKADARFAKTRNSLYAPVSSNPVADSPVSISHTQATHLDQLMQGINASAELQAYVNEQIAIYNLPFPSLKMVELAVFKNTVYDTLAQYRRHLARTAPTLLAETKQQMKAVN